MPGDPPICPFPPYPYQCHCSKPIEYFQPIVDKAREAKLEELLVEVQKFLASSMFLIGADKIKVLVKELKE